MKYDSLLSFANFRWSFTSGFPVFYTSITVIDSVSAKKILTAFASKAVFVNICSLKDNPHLTNIAQPSLYEHSRYWDCSLFYPADTDVALEFTIALRPKEWRMLEACTIWYKLFKIITMTTIAFQCKILRKKQEFYPLLLLNMWTGQDEKNVSVVYW